MFANFGLPGESLWRESISVPFVLVTYSSSDDTESLLSTMRIVNIRSTLFGARFPARERDLCEEELRAGFADRGGHLDEDDGVHHLVAERLNEVNRVFARDPRTLHITRSIDSLCRRTRSAST
jgi:hypothetical protein